MQGCSAHPLWHPLQISPPAEVPLAPLCSRHKQRAVLSTVRKAGANQVLGSGPNPNPDPSPDPNPDPKPTPNQGRPFYICPMPRGACCGFVAWRDPAPPAPPAAHAAPLASQWPPASQPPHAAPAAAAAAAPAAAAAAVV